MTWLDIGPQPLRLSPESHQAIDDLLDATVEWEAGRLPLPAVMGLGGIKTPAYTRMVAIRTTPLDDPRRRSLMHMLDASLVAQGWTVSRQGVFSSREIYELEQSRIEVEAMKR